MRQREPRWWGSVEPRPRTDTALFRLVPDMMPLRLEVGRWRAARIEAFAARAAWPLVVQVRGWWWRSVTVWVPLQVCHVAREVLSRC